MIFGAIAGWLTTLVNKTNQERGWIGNIVLGLVGALVGGLVFRVISGDGFDFGFNIGSLFVAIAGALTFSWAWGKLAARTR